MSAFAHLAVRDSDGCLLFAEALYGLCRRHRGLLVWVEDDLGDDEVDRLVLEILAIRLVRALCDEVVMGGRK